MTQKEMNSEYLSLVESLGGREKVCKLLKINQSTLYRRLIGIGSKVNYESLCALRYIVILQGNPVKIETTTQSSCT